MSPQTASGRECAPSGGDANYADHLVKDGWRCPAFDGQTSKNNGWVTTVENHWSLGFGRCSIVLIDRNAQHNAAESNYTLDGIDYAVVLSAKEFADAFPQRVAQCGYADPQQKAIDDLAAVGLAVIDHSTMNSGEFITVAFGVNNRCDADVVFDGGAYQPVAGPATPEGYATAERLVWALQGSATYGWCWSATGRDGRFTPMADAAAQCLGEWNGLSDAYNCLMFWYGASADDTTFDSVKGGDGKLDYATIRVLSTGECFTYNGKNRQPSWTLIRGCS